MRTDELNYNLPADLIATRPAQPRDSARLMVIERATQSLYHRQVRDLADTLEPGLQAGDLLVVNQTKVLPAYFTGERESTGGKIEGLYISSANDNNWIVMLESRGKLQAGERITLNNNAREAGAMVAGKTPALLLEEKLEGGKWHVKVESKITGLPLLHKIGSTPLPPYIRKARKQKNLPQVKEEDSQRYNTVYSKIAGSLAAPTAGLHFTDALLDKLKQRGIRQCALTLHVGLGTFMPVRTETLEDHHMHSESIHVPKETIQAILQTKKQGGRVIAVGTTSVRAMESLPDDIENIQGDFATDTELFIYPGSGFQFRFTDGLLTNFHLPKSTLLAMVASLPDVGLQRLLGWYQQAIEHKYRFYSYGDAMLIL